MLANAKPYHLGALNCKIILEYIFNRRTACWSNEGRSDLTFDFLRPGVRCDFKLRSERSATCRAIVPKMARTETVTVVFTDLVGSTELASRLGHDRYEALRHEHFAALRTAVSAHGGAEVKTTGDGLMLRFDSAAGAIACAVAMQQATDGHACRRPLY